MKLQNLALLVTSCLIFTFKSYAYEKLYLLKQWHLAPRVDTHLMSTGDQKKLPQYENQHDLYLKTLNLIQMQEKKSVIVFAEGCEGEINKNFKTQFNGWSYSALMKQSSTKKYEHIITHIPLKLSAFLKSTTKTLCIDNTHLVSSAQLALSDARAFLGFYTRLKEFKDKHEQVKFDLYAKTMFEKVPLPEQKKGALFYAKNHLALAIKKFKQTQQQRNQLFADSILKNAESYKTGFFIVGGLHVSALQEILKDKISNIEVITPQGYDSTDEDLLVDLDKTLSTL